MHTRAYISGYLYKTAGDMQSRLRHVYDPGTQRYMVRTEESPAKVTGEALEMRRNRERTQKTREAYARGEDPLLEGEKNWRQMFKATLDINPRAEHPNKEKSEARRAHRGAMADFLRKQNLGIDIAGYHGRKASFSGGAVGSGGNGPTIAGVTDIIKKWVSKAKSMSAPDVTDIVRSERTGK